ncbi:hypothetical protein CN899_29050, partial [Bacillus thuringiensis]
MTKKRPFKKNLKTTLSTVTAAGILLTGVSPSFAEELQKEAVQEQVPTEERQIKPVDELVDAEENQGNTSLTGVDGALISSEVIEKERESRVNKTIKVDTVVDINKLNWTLQPNGSIPPTLTSVKDKYSCILVNYSQYEEVSVRKIQMKFLPLSNTGRLFFDRTHNNNSEQAQLGVHYNFDTKKWGVSAIGGNIKLRKEFPNMVEFTNEKIAPKLNEWGEITVYTSPIDNKTSVYYNGELVLKTKQLAPTFEYNRAMEWGVLDGAIIQVGGVTLGEEEPVFIFSPPVVNEVTNKDTKVTGTAAPNANLELQSNYKGTGTKALYTGKADEYGNFEITLNQPQKVGSKIGVKQSLNGKNSEYTEVVVQAALEAPQLNAVYPTDTIVTGTGNPNTTVIAKIGNAAFTGSVDAEGKLSIDIEDPYPIGTEIQVYVKDANGKESEITTIHVQEDAAIDAKEKVEGLFTDDKFDTIKDST